MRIVIFSHACIVPVNRELFLGLEAKHELLFVTPAKWKGSLIRNLAAESNAKVCAYPVLNSGNGSLFFYISFLNEVAQFQPDLLFIDEEPWSLAAFQIYCRFPKVKKVFYTKQNLRKKVPWPFSWIQKGIFKKSSSAFVISEEAEEVLRWKGYKGSATILPHSFNRNKFCIRETSEKQEIRKQFGLPAQAFLTGYFGRITEEKGIHDLLQCAEALYQENKSVVFVLVGNGPLFSEVKKFAKKYPSQIFALGALPHDKVHSLMAAVDVTLLPSRTTKTWKEQFGRVIIESAACGVPVIGSDSGEIPRVIEQAHCGMAFREGDVTDLKRALLRFYDDPKFLKATAEVAGETAPAVFSHEVVADALSEDLARLDTAALN